MQGAEITLQVQFYDTDSLGIIYYGSYYRFFEAGLLKFLKNAGLTFTELAQKGIYLPASKSSCRYLAPSRLEETLKIITTLAQIGHASLTFKHEVYNLDQGNKLVAVGETRHACVSPQWKIIALPSDIAKRLPKDA